MDMHIPAFRLTYCTSISFFFGNETNCLFASQLNVFTHVSVVRGLLPSFYTCR